MVKKGYFNKGVLVFSVVALTGALVACSPSTDLKTEVASQQAEAAATDAKSATAKEDVAAPSDDAKPEADTASKPAEVSKGSRTFGSAKTTDKKDAADDKASSTAKKPAKKADATNKDAKANSNWSLDMDCAVCHTVEGESMEHSESATCIHVKEAEATCGTCHTDEDALADVHGKAKANAKMPKKLKKTTIEAETCLSSDCHDLTNDELIALTKDITDCTDSKGTTVNPHEVMGLTPGHDNITCGNCHKMHAEEIDAANTCVSCHHAGVYECGTCH